MIPPTQEKPGPKGVAGYHLTMYRKNCTHCGNTKTPPRGIWEKSFSMWVMNNGCKFGDCNRERHGRIHREFTRHCYSQGTKPLFHSQPQLPLLNPQSQFSLHHPVPLHRPKSMNISTALVFWDNKATPAASPQEPKPRANSLGAGGQAHLPGPWKAAQGHSCVPRSLRAHEIHARLTRSKLSARHCD